ncbi:MAG: hypothetical protein GY725_18730 [bacterium]|nr:hypothetical protein [bacterium]
MSQWRSVAEYKVEVLAYVAENDFVSFAALHKQFAGDSREETQIALPGNRIIWSGMPRPLVDAILELLEEQSLAAIPGHKSDYKTDGRVLTLPVEKTIPPEGHDEPHWFPVLLRPMASVLDEQD